MDGRWFLQVSAASLLLLVVATTAGSETAICRLQDCPKFRAIRYYQQLGCKRSDNSSECCPTRFDCSVLQSLDGSKCYYDGKSYDSNDLIMYEVKSDHLTFCWCTSVGNETQNKQSFFVCGSQGCIRPQIPEGKESICYRTYRVDEYCRSGLNCVNDTKSPRNVTECVYKGKTYLEGQIITEATSECMRCVCQEGFDGTLREPWCRSHRCERILNEMWTVPLLQKCAPVFSEGNACCAESIVCPSDEEMAVGSPESSTVNEGRQCKFGNQTLNIGDVLLRSSSHCLRCSCDIPPFLTCVIQSNKPCAFVKELKNL